MEFAQIKLELIDALHVGAGRAGMVSRTHGFVPGHVVAYALAAVLGRQAGGQPAHYDDAVEAVRNNVRCGPLFLLAPPEGSYLFPRRDSDRIADEYFIGVNHNALDGFRRAARDGALFEVEAISRRPLHSPYAGPTMLAGGLWVKSRLKGRVFKALEGVVLGGERNAGLGRVRLDSLKARSVVAQYANAGSTPPAVGGRRKKGRKKKRASGASQSQRAGIYLKQGDLLPGPALNGVTGAPLQPWLGRLHDRKRGAGRRFSPPMLVRLDGYAEKDGWFELETDVAGFGCWKYVPD